MNKFFRVSFLAVALCSVMVLTSCEDDPELPENKVEFQSSTLGIGESEAELVVNLKLVRGADGDGTVTVELAPSGVVYGTQFTTEPAATNGKIQIPVAATASTASFKVIKVADAAFTAEDNIKFTITEVSDVFVLGTQKELTLSFAEIVAEDGSMEIAGGGPKAPNRVFIDLSGNRQLAVARTTWDLAFSSSGDNFRVVLNSTNKMLARAIDKTDLASVTAADTVDFGGQLDLDAIFGIAATLEIEDFPEWIHSTLSWIDDPKGDITKTAIAEVSATDSENKVYIVNRGVDGDGNKLGWVKLRVLRSGSNYTLQYANIADTNIKSVTVTKDNTTPFNYVSLTSGEGVSVEPASWDIAWNGFTNVTPTGSEPTDPFIPYYFSDMIITNIAGGASTFTYTTGTTGDKTYDTFTAADAAGLAFVGNNQLSIGSSWRVTGGPPPSPPAGVNASRFYIIKDADGNIYKLQFTALVTSGERGRPQFRFELLTKGS